MAEREGFESPRTQQPKSLMTRAFRLTVSALEQAERCKRMQRGQAKNRRLANPWQISGPIRPSCVGRYDVGGKRLVRAVPCRHVGDFR